MQSMVLCGSLISEVKVLISSPGKESVFSDTQDSEVKFEKT